MFTGAGRKLIAGLVWAVPVVVPLVGSQGAAGMRLVENEDMVERFPPDGADDPLAVGVHPRRPRRALDHVQFVGLEDGVECLAVRAVAVPQQEARSAGTSCVCPSRRPDFAPAGRGVDVEEVCGDNALGLSREERAPGRVGATRCRIDVGCVQDVPDRRGSDPVSGSSQLSLGPLMPQRGLSRASLGMSVLIAAGVGGRPVRRRAV